MRLSLSIIAALALSSCCTLVNGRSQQMRVVSNAPDTKIYIDGNLQQFTCPTAVTVSRSKKAHHFRLEAPGYHPLDVLWPSRLSAWSLGNFGFVAWFWVGDIVDFSTGSAWYYDDMTATLVPLEKKPKN